MGETLDLMQPIAFLNLTTVVSDSEAVACMNALQIQTHRDIAPVWGRDACFQFYTRAQAEAGQVPLAAWWHALLDRADIPNAGGVHDLTPDGHPLGKTFCRTEMDAGSQWTVAASHENAEMLGDPDVNLTVLLDDGRRGAELAAVENADPVEADEDGYDINSVRVSNFVTRDWFESFRRTGTFDYRKLLVSPFTLRPGGYMSVLPLTGISGGWQQITQASAIDARARARHHAGSRRSKRALASSLWLPSTLGASGTTLTAGKRNVRVP